MAARAVERPGSVAPRDLLPFKPFQSVQPSAAQPVNLKQVTFSFETGIPVIVAMFRPI